MKYFIFAFACSSLVAALIVYSRGFHGRFTADHDLTEVQKFHSLPVPRVGGAAIFLALWNSALLLLITESPHLPFYLLLMVPCSLVFFSMGIIGDITKRFSVQTRLLLTMLAALLGALLVHAIIRTFNIATLDVLLGINLVALLFTAVAVSSVTNAVKLIDGLNGLAGVICLMGLLALGVVSYFVHDDMLYTTAIIAAGAILGFLIWNYPRAKIFLGDGGAYLVGFVIAELAVLLNERHRQVSAVFPLLVMIYPVFETLFTIYRRKFIRGRSLGTSDTLRLHHLINKRIVRWRVKPKGSIQSRGNAMTSPYLWALNSVAVGPAVLFWNKPVVLLGFAFLFIAMYVWLYRRIVTFRVPRWMFLPYQKQKDSQNLNALIAISSNTAWYMFNFRHSLIKTLQNQGYRILVLTSYDEYAPRLIESGCEYIEVKMQNSGTNPLRDIGVIWRYYAVLRRHKPAVLLTYTPKPNIYGAIAASFLSVPVITNISGLGRAFIEKNWITAVVKNLYQLALRHPTKVFFQNEDDKSIFLEMGYVKNAQADLLPGSGVDTEKFVPVQSAEGKRPFVFILVARMLKDKGVVEYVEAARYVKNIHANVRFQLVGFLNMDNPSAVSQIEMMQWVEEGVIEYPGSTDDVKQYFSQADCAVLPSYREGTPKTLLEAASMALPIITTDAPGCRNTVDHGVTGYMCNVKDVQGLADCMLKILQLPEQERKQMGLAGRRKMQRQFSEKIVLDAYLRAINEIRGDVAAPQAETTLSYMCESIDTVA